jgi:hypothetical protein
MVHLPLTFALIWTFWGLRDVYGATIYVDINSTSAALGCGLNLTSACPTIADGFLAASNGDTVELQAGIYSGEGNENLMSMNFTASQIIISGSTGDADDVVIFCSAPNRFLAANRYMYALIRDLTIRNCSAMITSPDSFGDGGALILVGVNNPVVISNVVFFGNKARNGGALFLEGGSVTTTNCVFLSNEAQYWGGAIKFIDSGLTVQGTVMQSNRAHGDLGDSSVNVDTNQAGKGGAIHGNGGSRLFLTDVDFAMNSAKLAGGAVFLNLVSGVSILRNLFTANTVYGGESCSSDQVCQVRGGAIYVKDVAVTLVNSTFIGNSAVTQDLSEVWYMHAVFRVIVIVIDV